MRFLDYEVELGLVMGTKLPVELQRARASLYYSSRSCDG
jgi:2-keto-4-pentenoate hydratase/2-oxohepta-3-ene-1,7-dioic acid hydratase in catechol pathway